MSNPSSSLVDRLDALRQAFVDKLDSRFEILTAATAAAVDAKDDAGRRQTLSDIHQHAHKLTGAAGTFGHTELAKAAQGLERATDFLLNQDAALSAADCADLPVFLEALRQARSSDEANDAAETSTIRVSSTALPKHSASAPAVVSKTVYVVEDDDEQARQLAAVLTSTGFQPTCFSKPADLAQALANHPPAAVIMDIMFPDAPEAGIETIQDCRDKGLLDCPVVFVSMRDDFSARLGAIRAGGDGYLAKPIDPIHVSNVLSKLTASVDSDPFRALVIDDDEDLALYYESVLESAHIDVRALMAPNQALDVLTDFRPDVIVTDINMPGCNGFELAELIHQHPAFVHTPIIFVTAEEHSLRRVMSMRSNGNDLLQKPVPPDLLLSSVIERAEHARLITSVTNLEKIRESEERFRQLADNIHEVFWISDSTRTVPLYVSPASNKIWQHAPNTFHTTPDLFLDLVHPDDRDAVQARRRTHVGKGLVDEYRILRPDGSVRWVHEKSFPVTEPDGRVERIAGVCEDITERKEAEEARRAADMSFRTMFEASPALIAISDPESGVHHDVNDAWLKTLGYEREEVIGKTAAEIGLWADFETRDDIVEAVTTHGAIRNFVGCVRAKDGTKIHVLISGEQISVAGKPRLLWVAQDITDRKREEEELERRVADATKKIEEQANYLGAVIENSAEGIITIDGQGTIQTFNQAASTIFGYSAEEMIGRDVSSLLPANERSEHRSYVQGSALYESRIINRARKLQGVRKDGTCLPLELNVSPMTVGGKKMFVGIVHDITERTEAQEKAARNAQIREVISATQSAFISEARRENAFGDVLDSFISLSDSAFGFIGEIHHDDGIPYLKTFAISDISWDDDSRKLYQENAANGLEFRNLDSLFGTTIKTEAVTISNDPANDPRSGGTPHGHPPLTAFLGLPLTVGNKMIGMVGIANRAQGYDDKLVDELQPIASALAQIIEADRAHMEREEAQKRAEEANQAKSEFLSSMSHELRTPLNAILGFGQLLQSDPTAPLNPDQSESISHILKSGEHLLGLINEVLELARIETGKLSLTLVDINPLPLLSDCLSLVATRADDLGISLIDETDKMALPPFHADETRARQILLNLLSNAVKYNTPGGSVTVTASTDTPARLRISVHDTGPGIPADRQAQLFEPFNRLGREDDAVEGSGIGLAITKKLVETMDGTIGFDSVEGKGSTFWFELPCGKAHTINPVTAAPTKAAPDAEPHGQTRTPHAETAKTVLYIEDNPANLHLMQHLVMRINGVTLLDANTAEDGLIIARDRKPDMILMDINLPGMSGIEAMKIIAKDPDLSGIPVIALSANAMTKDLEAGKAAGFMHYLTKPIDVDAITTTIKSVLFDGTP